MKDKFKKLLTMSKITILCNSPQCLEEITSGKYNNLVNEDIFTCNLAYTYFRTNARHLNIFTDIEPINNFLDSNHLEGIFSTHLYFKIEFILHSFQFHKTQLELNNKKTPYRLIKSNVVVNGSSGINALLYLVNNENYDIINLVGYSLNEWEGIKEVPELKPKLIELEKIKENYTINNYAPFCYEYKKINLNN